MVGRVCPQAGAAGTKGARPLGCRSVGKSQASRQIRRCSTIRDLCSLKAALLSPGKNLRKKTPISDIVIQRAVWAGEYLGGALNNLSEVVVFLRRFFGEHPT